MKKQILITKVTFHSSSGKEYSVSEARLDVSLDAIFLGLRCDGVLDTTLIDLDFSKVTDSVELREKLYSEGFELDVGGQKLLYKRYKRTASSSREGKFLFILEDKYDTAHEWSDAGLNDKGFPCEPVAITNGPNKVAYEAYQALTLSGLDDSEATFELSPKNILFVEDLESVFPCPEAIYIRKTTDTRPGETLYEAGGYKVVEAKKGDVPEVKNIIWDGESLLDESVFEDDILIAGKHPYKDKGMVLLRNRFFKTCAFNTKIRKWFEDHGFVLDDKVDLSRLNGYTEAETYRDIRMITTYSSLKYLKFFKKEDAIFAIKKWISVCEKDRFGIVKTDKKTRFYNGDRVRLNYQVFNTLMLDKNETDKLATNYIDLLRKLASDSQEFLEFNGDIGAFDTEFDEIDTNSNYFKNSVIETLLKHNKDFDRTALYKSFIHDFITSLKNGGKQGKLLVHGTNATLLSNPIELLKYVTKSPCFDMDLEALTNNTDVYCGHFEDGKRLLAARSPHAIMGNLYLTENQWRKEYVEYLNLTPEIVVVNSYRNNVMNRLQGCDYDSDFVFITDDENIVGSFDPFFFREIKPYKKFVVPVEDLNLGKQTEEVSLAAMDDRIRNNKVGMISDFSQQINSLFWHKYWRVKRTEMSESDMKEQAKSLGQLYYANSILSVLVGLEIDAAKKGYETNTGDVISEIKTLFPKKAGLPNFFRIVGDKEKKKQRRLDKGAFHLAEKNGTIYVIGSTLDANRIYKWRGKYHYDNTGFNKMPKKGWELLYDPNGFYLKLIIISRTIKEGNRRKSGPNESLSINAYAVLIDPDKKDRGGNPIYNMDEIRQKSKSVQDVINDTSDICAECFYVKVETGLTPPKENYVHYDTPMDYLFEYIDGVKDRDIYRNAQDGFGLLISDLFTEDFKRIETSAPVSKNKEKAIYLAKKMSDTIRKKGAKNLILTEDKEFKDLDEELASMFAGGTISLEDYLCLLQEIDAAIQRGYENVRNYHYILLYYMFSLKGHDKLFSIFNSNPLFLA